MKVTIEGCIRDFHGAPVADEKGRVITIQDAIILALNEGVKDRHESLARYKLCLKIISAPEITLTAGEVELILKGAANIFTPLVVGRLAELIDPDSLK